MSRFTRWSLVALSGLGIAMLLPATAEAQINNLRVIPSPACVGDLVTIQARGYR